MLDLLPPGPLPVASSAPETASSQGVLGTELAVLASLSCKCSWPLPDVRGPVTNFLLFCFNFFLICLCPPVGNEYMLIIENVGKTELNRKKRY